ncbi:MAG: ferrochelatase [Rhodoferax sp.]
MHWITSPYAPEPALRHGQAPRTAIVFCNLGTPDAPTPTAVRRYLAEFLGDPRVVEVPRLLWLMILHGVILRVRPKRSAAKYATVWQPEGSPLKLWTERQAQALQTQLTARGHELVVRMAMRYGADRIDSVLDDLQAQGVTRVLVLPAYPQYSATTTASVFDAVYQWAGRTRRLPELRFVNHYHDDDAYIGALAASVLKHWAQHGQPDRLLMSFHGVPERNLHLGDPYHCECHKTARLLAQRLGLDADRYQVSFQSRLGRAKWLQPYTEPTLIALAQQGVRRVDVICPAFTSDCLETLEEINQEARAAFLGAGGQTFHYIGCLNDQPAWIDALSNLAERHLSGWPTREAPDAQALQASRDRALALGAQD